MVAGLFLVAMFFSPVAAAIPAFATAPTLILVGALMTVSIAEVEWRDLSEAFPAFVTLIATPLTFSIANGLGLGVISYTIAKLAARKRREVSALLWLLTILFIARYAYLAAE
jgi:AGZA family xanthine/uracil permease-like MFS transporter